MAKLPKLQTRFDIAAWYETVRNSGDPVIWCSAFAPAEALMACGLQPVYPENHAAMLGALGPQRGEAERFSDVAISTATSAGHSTPKLCAYALADIGVVLGAPSPIGSLPDADAFYACDSQCAVVKRWGDAVQAAFAERGRAIPHYVLHAPAPKRNQRHNSDQLVQFANDLRGHCEDLGKRFGTGFDENKLQTVVAESAAANRLWQQCLELARHRPAPWTMFDAFQAMAPIVIARGHPSCTDFYRRLLAELQQRITDGIAAVADERIRLCWDAIPIWPRKNWFANFLGERGVAVVTSTYTHSWWFAFDTNKPWDSLVERYAWNTMNRSSAWVLGWTLDLCSSYNCDGVIAHWNRSCGIWNSYVKRRGAGYAANMLPECRIEADMVDTSAFDESRISGQLLDFIKQLESGAGLVPANGASA